MSTETPSRPATRSERLSIRITPAGKDAIRKMAASTGWDEAEIARRLLQYGLQHMPPPTKRSVEL